MAEREDDAVLDLNVLVERPRIKINGQTFHMRSGQEMSALDFFRISKQAERVQELNALIEAQPSEKDIQAMLALLDELSRFLLVDVPEELMSKLTEQHKIKVVGAFTRLQLADAAAAEAQETAEEKSAP